ncbi:MAG: DUF305 domain-containing protein [Spirochaetaceae bacterium]|nr:MAG: DUF305 domain-containing protein [Spirochaetaceae bacterium]
MISSRRNDKQCQHKAPPRPVRVVGLLALLLLLTAGTASAHMHSRGRWASEADYLAMMIPHHQEAVDSARELLQITQRQEMVDLLESIIAEQTSEIELMQSWLTEYHPGTQASDEYQPMMRSYEGLDSLEADLVFLEDMHHHHMHAVMTSRMLLRSSAVENREVGQLARNIISSQLVEIDLMRDLYAEWSDQDSFRGQRGMHGRRPNRRPGRSGR